MDQLRRPSIDRPARLWGAPWLALPLVLLLAACSGTPFGDQLGGSFPDGEAPAADATAAPAPTGAAGAPQPAQGAAPGGTPAAGASAAQPATPGPAGAGPPATNPPAPTPPAPAVTPVPYRLTLRLAGADPAAPAEEVTRALRAAGLAFEVEVIERLPAGTAPAAPASTPAPTPAASPSAR